MSAAGDFIVFRRLTLRGSRYFFHARAANHEIIAQSQGYRDRRSAYGGIAALKRIAAFGAIKDESESTPKENRP